MAEEPPDASVTKPAVPALVRIVGLLLRAVFLVALVVVAIRVSAPQSETVWSAYETPGDLIRLVLGAASRKNVRAIGYNGLRRRLCRVRAAFICTGEEG